MCCAGPAPEARWFDLRGGPRYECPGREAAATWHVIPLWRAWKHGHLPDPGGYLDQSRPLVLAIDYLQSTAEALRGQGPGEHDGR